MINSLDFAQEYARKFGNSKLTKLLENSMEHKQSRLSSFYNLKKEIGTKNGIRNETK